MHRPILEPALPVQVITRPYILFVYLVGASCFGQARLAAAYTAFKALGSEADGEGVEKLVHLLLLP